LLLSCRCYITPKLFLDLLQQYSTLLNTAKAELGGNRRRLLDGIAKLAETNAALDAMQSQLNSLQPLLVEKTANTSALLKQVSLCCSDHQRSVVAGSYVFGRYV
jgi:dynein heavy chain